jgi:hypothetical protein
MNAAALLLVALTLLLLAGCTTVGPRSESTGTYSGPADFHADFDSFLRRHVDDRGRVDYRAALADRADLDRYIALLARVSPDSHPDWFPGYGDRLAYWINAYNASVLQLVLHDYPIDSVKDVGPPVPLFFLPQLSGFFVFRQVTLGGEPVNLYQLENGVIRERFAEPRIHFAINCASIGCPRLPAEAFQPERLEQQLARETRRFVSESRNVEIDPTLRVVRLSSIFDWFESDFTDWVKWRRPSESPTLLSYVRLHASAEQAARLAACNDCEVEFIPYDWGLNDVTVLDAHSGVVRPRIPARGGHRDRNRLRVFTQFEALPIQRIRTVNSNVSAQERVSELLI